MKIAGTKTNVIVVIWEIADLVQHGVANLGVFHALKPLKFNKNGNIESEDFKLLYYYHNRLENYELDKAIQWNALKTVALPA